MAAEDVSELGDAVDAWLPRAGQLFDALERVSADGGGVTRDAYGAGEQAARDVIAEAARELDLEVGHDAAGNLYAVLAGKDRSAPAIAVGSHLDSVPRGGNFDGAAGIVAGLAAVSALRRLGAPLARDVMVVGLRGEESPWFGTAYLGSRLALGALPLDQLDELRRFDTGRTLAEHMADLGLDVAALRRAGPRLSPANLAAYFELHIEQGPVLMREALPIAIATAVRGNARYPFARCLGAYAHSAAVPRADRSDAVLAAVELVAGLDRFWQSIEASGGGDAVFTVGKFFTDGDLHAMTKVPGTVDFTLNFGSTRPADLEAFRSEAEALAEEIGRRRRVRFELGQAVGTDPVALDGALREGLGEACAACGQRVFEMPTVGHDAAIFTKAGIPAAMILVRNAHGSHNADEAMDLADFGVGCKVLAAAIGAVARS